MNSANSIACIIPCYNEAPRLRKVFNIASKSQYLDRLICVNDGSTDATGDIVAHEYPKVNLITNPKNLGKTRAVIKGLAHVTEEYVLMLDADLHGLKLSELDNALSVAKKGTYDMIVMRRTRHKPYVKLLRGDILISGERIVRTDVFKKRRCTNRFKAFKLRQRLTSMH
ncbi:MAG: Poly-beta-1,6-N-acetyl-D-glucosamine synthase [Microgenomates bacterium OLB23]|nr:MAG: Poly-beta-1,6-N-acetyl-D-glucosamine synthase [Microgenomates bacterium OLB23]